MLIVIIKNTMLHTEIRVYYRPKSTLLMNYALDKDSTDFRVC